MALATALVVTVAAGAAAAVNGGLFAIGSSCRDSAVHITVAASPDVAPALKALADHARERDITSDGRCIDVAVTARESYQVAQSLRSGKRAGFQAWVPDSDVWVDGVTTRSGALQVTKAGNVASSPVGVAMVPSAATSLGWPAKTYTWAELADASMRDDRFRLGAADPARSATGLLALTRLSGTADGTEGGGIRAAALAKTLSPRTSDSDRQVLDTLPATPPVPSGATRGATRRCSSPSSRRSFTTPRPAAGSGSTCSIPRTDHRGSTTPSPSSTGRG